MRWALVLALAMLAGGFSGCIGGGKAFTVEAPDWQPGYSFSYSEEGDYRATAKARAGSETDSDESAEHYGPFTQILEVVNTTLGNGEAAYLLVATIPKDEGKEDPSPEAPTDCGPIACPTIVQIKNFLTGARQNYLADLQVQYDSEFDCDSAQRCRVKVSELRFQPGPDHEFLDFPLTRGKTWSGKIGGGFVNGEDAGEDIGVRVTAQAKGRTTVETPLGRIDAVRVEFRYEFVGVDELRRKMQAEAQEEGVKVDRFDLRVEAIRQVYYSESYQTVVKTDYTMHEYAYVKARDRDGKVLEAEAESNVQGQRVLTGAHLIPRPERNLDEVARILADQLPIADPTGKAYRPIEYSVDVSVDKASLNAGEGETASFTTKLTGRDTLPEGHKVQWRILGPLGTVVAEGTGLTFSQNFTEPGVYTAEVEGVDETGNVTSADGASVVAHFRKTIKVDCPNVGFEPSVRGCPLTSIPVRPGIYGLKVDAKATGPLGPASTDRLQLRDTRGGQMNDLTRSGDTYSVELKDFSDWALGAHDWTIQLYQQRAVLEDVEYTVDLDYGPSAEDDAVGPTGLPTVDALFATFGV